MLEQFGTGWRNLFEKRLSAVKRIFPDIELKSAERRYGMLKLDFSTPSDDIAYVLSCISYRIERESARKCENCGRNGIRRTGDIRLPEPKCLCVMCYALELDAYYTQNNNN